MAARILILIGMLALTGCAVFGYGVDVQTIHHGGNRYTVISSADDHFYALRAAKHKAQKICQQQLDVPDYINIKTTTEDLSEETLEQLSSVTNYETAAPANKHTKSQTARVQAQLDGDFTTIVDFDCVTLKESRQH